MNIIKLEMQKYIFVFEVDFSDKIYGNICNLCFVDLEGIQKTGGGVGKMVFLIYQFNAFL
jgi:hypothetical protein